MTVSATAANVSRAPGMAAVGAGNRVHFQVDNEGHLMFFDDDQGRRIPIDRVRKRIGSVR